MNELCTDANSIRGPSGNNDQIGALDKAREIENEYLSDAQEPTFTRRTQAQENAMYSQVLTSRNDEIGGIIGTQIRSDLPVPRQTAIRTSKKGAHKIRTPINRTRHERRTSAERERSLQERGLSNSEWSENTEEFLVCTSLMTSLLLFAAVLEKTNKSRADQPQFRRCALLRHTGGRNNTPWRRILTFGTELDYLVSTNLTKTLIIETILPCFERHRNQTNHGSPFRRFVKRRGRKPQLQSIDLIGIVLWYLKSKDCIYRMCPIFGVVPSTMSVWLNYAMEVMLKVVQDESMTAFSIKWPTVEEMRLSASLLQQNRTHGSLLRGVFGVCDGGRMPCVTYSDPPLQNAYWEGFTQAHEVTNLFVWNFHGELIHAAINFPGSWHDSRLAAVSGLHRPKLSEMTPSGFAILADSAFPRGGGDLAGKIIRARKANEHGDRSGVPRSSWMAAVEVMLERAMSSERQSAEWGVRALKGPFKRLTTKLPPDSWARYRLLAVSSHLYNFRVRKVGLNQIKTVYFG